MTSPVHCKPDSSSLGGPNHKDMEAEKLPLSSRMSAAETSLSMLEAERPSPAGLLEGHPGKKLQGKCLALVSPVTAAKVYCCFSILTVLFMSVVALSVALSVKKAEVITEIVYTACPRNWIGFGNKCFYFSEDTRNWTFSRTSCMELKAQLAQFENLEELNFLRRYKGDSDHWIGLHRESFQHAWKWADGTEYISLVSIRGVGECAYLNDNGISSARFYVDRKWACSKPAGHIQCQTSSTSF